MGAHVCVQEGGFHVFSSNFILLAVCSFNILRVIDFLLLKTSASFSLNGKNEYLA